MDIYEQILQQKIDIEHYFMGGGGLGGNPYAGDPYQQQQYPNMAAGMANAYAPGAILVPYKPKKKTQAEIRRDKLIAKRDRKRLFGLLGMASVLLILSASWVIEIQTIVMGVEAIIGAVIFIGAFIWWMER